MSSCRVFVAFFVVLHHVLPDIIPVAKSLSIQQPPSKNPDVLRSYVFGDDARCWEVLSPSSTPDEEEDEVEYWYPTRKRSFEFSIPSASIASSTATTIRQTSFGCGKLGAQVWVSGIALCLYLGQCRQQESSLVAEKRVLELGAGCGLPSVVCRDEFEASAVLATDFWDTETEGFDKDRLVPTKFHGLNLEHNVLLGSSEEVRSTVQRLDWHDPAGAEAVRDSFQPDLVIGSDLIYYPMDVEPLLNVLEILLAGEKGKGTTRAVLVSPLAPTEREALPEFRSKLPDRFSQTHTVTMKEMDLVRDDTSGEDSAHIVIHIDPK